ncbi:MAG: sensor histidine kinase [Chloroflexi bacterium]|nr:sensor histidine kinase [Chloroflexota bacterium]
MVISALVYARSPSEVTPRWHAHGYFAVQTFLFGALLALAPNGRAQFCLLFFILCSQVMMLFRWQTGLIWLSVFALVTGTDFVWVSGFPNGLIELFPFFSGYFFFGVISYLWAQTDSARRESARLLGELQAANAQLRKYAERVEELTIAEERNRLAHEIHDTLGHTLTALDIQLELLACLPLEKSAERRQATENARTLVKQGLVDTRRAVQAMRPAALETFSLPEAIAALVEDFERTTQIQVTWATRGSIVPLATRIALPLYRAAQEALTNIRRHAPSARHVQLQLGYALETVSLRADNDGATLVESNPSGFGLRGLSERAEALGGTFRVGLDGDNFNVEMTLPHRSEFALDLHRAMVHHD